MDNFDCNNVEVVQNYINFWNQHISTWHPDKHSSCHTINQEAVIAYVAKYASNAEKSSSSYQYSLRKAICHLKTSDAAGVAYQKMLSSFVAERDISCQETCHILHNLPLVHTSRQYRSISLIRGQTSEEVKFESSEKEKKSVFDRYKERLVDLIPELANVSLWQVATSCN